MFRVSGYIDLAKGRPGMLVPVFLKDGTNTPFVQSMDEHYCIEEFFPYYQYEQFDFISESRLISAAIGRNGVIAFRAVAGDVWCGGPSTASEYLSLHAEGLDERPLLKLQLLRIAGAPLAQQYEEWRSTSERYFHSANQKAHWLDAELVTFQNSEKIWSRIRSKRSSEGAPRISLADQIDTIDSEELFEALSDPGSFEAAGWDVVWFKLKDRLPVDERMYHLASEWLYSIFGSNLEIGRARNVLAESLRFWRSAGHYDDLTQFAEFIVELVRSGELFSDELGLSFSSLMAGLELCGYVLSDEEYLSLLLQILAEHYFSSAHTEALLRYIESVAQPEKILASELWPNSAVGRDEVILVEAWKDAAAKNQVALKCVLDKLHLLDKRLPGVRAFRRKWKPLLLGEKGRE